MNFSIRDGLSIGEVARPRWNVGKGRYHVGSAVYSTKIKRKRDGAEALNGRETTGNNTTVKKYMRAQWRGYGGRGLTGAERGGSIIGSNLGRSNSSVDKKLN
jgi:hypothetical protein